MASGWFFVCSFTWNDLLPFVAYDLPFPSFAFLYLEVFRVVLCRGLNDVSDQ